VGGEGNSFIVIIFVGLTLRFPALSAWERVPKDLWLGRESLRGWEFTGIDDILSGMMGGWPSRTEREGLRCLRVGLDMDAEEVTGRPTAIVMDAEAECDFFLCEELDAERLGITVDCGRGEGCGLVFWRVVGFGGESDFGGFVLGFSVGGGRGMGVN
jgi:hypothetical protein